MSYSCTDNLEKIIKRHNRRVIKKNQKKKQESNTKECNCRNINECPLQNKCQKENVVYKATISSLENPNITKHYIGLSKTKFKFRFANHTASFNNEDKKGSTTLSKYYWELLKAKENPRIKWSIIMQAPPCVSMNANCFLCLNEKFEILQFRDKANLLNQRKEIANKCRHKKDFLLQNYPSRIT